MLTLIINDFRRHITTKHNISIDEYGSKYENSGPVQMITEPPPVVENKLLPPGPAIATASATNLLQQQEEEQQKSAVLSRTSFILQQQAAGVGLKPNVVVVAKPQEEIIIKVNEMIELCVSNMFGISHATAIYTNILYEKYFLFFYIFF